MANVTMLKLATVESQRCEFAVRLMHGARWWRIARGQMVEQAMLGGAAAVCAVGVAQVAGGGLGRFGVAPLLDTGRWTISLAGGLAFVAAVAVGWLATVRVRAMESSGGLQAIAGGRGATAFPRLMYGFLTVQVALSVALVCGALVLVQHLQSRLRLDHGFEPDKVLSVRIPLRQAGYTATNAGVVRRALMREIGALPGVGRAGWARSVPFDGVTLLHEVEAEVGEGESRLVIANFVDRGFFAAMTIPVLRGREFSEDERWRGEVVVSQRLAAMLWPGGVGVGEPLRAAHDGRTFEVVGVVGNTRYRNPGEGMEPVVYFAPDDALSTGYVLVKTDVPAWSMIGAVRARIREVDPRVATHDVRSMGAFIDAVLGQERQAAVGVGGFGVIGLVLVGAGLYAATARMVALRRREIGVRVALGARPGDVWRRLLGDGGMVLGAGAAGVWEWPWARFG